MIISDIAANEVCVRGTQALHSVHAGGDHKTRSDEI